MCTFTSLLPYSHPYIKAIVRRHISSSVPSHSSCRTESGIHTFPGMPNPMPLWALRLLSLLSITSNHEWSIQEDPTGTEDNSATSHGGPYALSMGRGLNTTHLSLCLSRSVVLEMKGFSSSLLDTTAFPFPAYRGLVSCLV